MDADRQQASHARDRRRAGPQGTRLYSAEELRQFAGRAGVSDQSRASVHEPVLQGLGPDREKQRFTLRAGRQTLGRRRDNDIVVDDLSVSGSHAWIMNQQGHYVIMNTLSTNGTFVNDRRVHEAVLRHGDRIRLGQVEFMFLTREPGSRQRARLVSALLVLLVIAACVAGWWWLG